MANGFSPYQQAAQQEYQNQSPYGMGMGRGGYSRYRPNLGGAVTGPTESGGTGGSEVDLMEDKAAAQADMRQRGAVAAGSMENLQAGGQANAVQNARTIKDYRQVRDSGIGNDNLNTSNDQRQQAMALGIDPSADAHEIAKAASGPVGFDVNGMPMGGNTGNGSLAPGSGDVASAAAAAQNAKDGVSAGTQANSYAKGYASTQPPVTTASPYGSGAPSSAMPPMPPLTLNMPQTPAAAMPTPTPIPGAVAPQAGSASTPPTAPPASTLSPFQQQVAQGDQYGQAKVRQDQAARAALPLSGVNAPLKPNQIRPFGNGRPIVNQSPRPIFRLGLRPTF